ncbi:MAG: phosphoribosylformylglycinamidine synthase subunit PurQ [Candidatus Bathyarchaeota archaeon]
MVIPVGYGLNCEDETGYGFEMVGAKVDRVFIKDLTEKPHILEDYQILAMVGGFSFGDHIAAGKVLANIYKFKLGMDIYKFIDDGKLIFAECNGFQTLVKAGILPGFEGDYRTQRATLTYNVSGVFEDRWVRLKVNTKSSCVFTRGLEELNLPVRHGEGKFVLGNNSDLQKLRDGNQIVLQYADKQKLPTMSYPQNPNGSVEAIAGVCDPTGRVFGKMPHSTAYLSPYNHPHWTRVKAERSLPKEGEGVQVLRNAVEYARRNLT